MKLKPEYKLRQMAGENIIITASGSTTDLTRVIALNDTAARLWQELSGHDFTAADAVAVLCRTYDVAPAQAARDVAAWLRLMRTHGLLCD